MNVCLYINRKLVHTILIKEPEKLSYVELGRYVTDAYLYLRNKYIREMARAFWNYEIVVMRESKMNEGVKALEPSIQKEVPKIYVTKKTA